LTSQCILPFALLGSLGRQAGRPQAGLGQASGWQAANGSCLNFALCFKAPSGNCVTTFQRNLSAKGHVVESLAEGADEEWKTRRQADNESSGMGLGRLTPTHAEMPLAEVGWTCLCGHNEGK